VPITVKLRDETEAAAKQALEAGDLLAAGKKLTDLVQIYKWVQPSDGSNCWPAAAAAGTKAIECLRQCDDQVALARALRVTSVVTFDTSLLEESFELSQRIGDEKGAAWCLLQQSHRPKPGSNQAEMRQQALEIFERCDDALGQAVVLQSVALTLDREERTETYVRSAELYSRVGEWDDAARSYILSQTFSSKMGTHRRFAVLQRAASYARKTRNRNLLRTIYRQIARLRRRRSRRPSL